VRRSGLVDDEQLKRVVGSLVRTTGRLPHSMQPLADALLAEQLITPWQLRHLSSGRTRGFFLGRYKLLSFLSTGGMSTVYLAEHTLVGRKVALKVLLEGQVEPVTLERFRRECLAIGSLDHDNIVRAHDFATDGQFHYLVMEYVPGSNLESLVSTRGPLAPYLAADYLRQAARGLACAHAAGYIHRDIKPANLLLSNKGVVKLLDLGVAKIAELDHTRLTVDNQQTLLGTVDYLAPEQAVDSHAVDKRADLYSFGCTLFYLLIGRPPFDKGTQAQRLLSHQITPPPSLRNLRPDVPRGLDWICRKLMAKKPEQRYPSCEALINDLDGWLAEADRVTATESPTVLAATGERASHPSDTPAVSSPLGRTIATASPMVKVVCHECQSHFGAPARSTDRPVKCPYCGTLLMVPGTSPPADRSFAESTEVVDAPEAARIGGSPAQSP
jgi:serine/threonine protein kinase